MKLLVCISKVPDTTAKINFTDNNTKFDESGVNFIVNPYDEWYALVRALELKEAQGGSVTILNVGPADNDAIIRKALAVGADDAVRINLEPQDAAQIAGEISNYAKDQGYDIIFFGKETIDYNGSIVPGLVAGQLDLPYVAYASKLDMEGNKATLVRDILGGSETVSVETPFVVSAMKGMAEQRIPNMRGIMQARTKPLNVVEASGAAGYTSVKSYEKPEDKGETHYIDAENPGELWDLLKNEAKVL